MKFRTDLKKHKKKQVELFLLMVELLFILFNLKVIIFIDDRVIIYFIKP